MFELTGNVALVTGASRGLGAAIARCLAQAGADVAVNYSAERSLPDAEAVAASIRALGRRAMVVRADVSREEDVRAMTEAVAAQLGGPDILCANAGVNSSHDIFDLDYAEWQRIQNTNIGGAFLCCKYAVPIMKEKGYGRIILTSSVTGQTGALFGQVHYASTKAAQQGFARTLARTVARDGITVNCVAPGTHMTETLQKILVEADPHRLDAAIAMTPVGHIGSCEDIGWAVVYLASREAGFVTGAVLDVNGGYYMRA